MSSSQDVARATPATNRPAASPERREPAAGRAVLGPSIVVRGDIDGDEDLLVEGRVEGKISLRNHHVTVGRRGTVQADILARTVTVEGSVEGNLQGDEQIALRPTGRALTFERRTGRHSARPGGCKAT